MKNMTIPEVLAAVLANCGDFFGEARAIRLKPDGEVFYADETDTGKLKMSEVPGTDIRAAYVRENGQAGILVFGRVAVDLMPLVLEISKSAGRFGPFKIWRCIAARTNDVTLVTTEGTLVLSTKKHHDGDLSFDNHGNPTVEAYNEKGDLVTLA